jgi:hypothetical protein
MRNLEQISYFRMPHSTPRLLRARFSAPLLALLFYPLPLNSSGPPPLDTDADGWPDAEEYFLGTDPGDRGSAFRIRQVERLQGSPQTRLRWHSIASKNYRIEASPTLAADSWERIRTLVGTGGVMETEIPDDPANLRKYFRIETDYDTALPPWIGPVSAPGVPLTRPGFLPLRVQAWHPLGVSGVVFRNGGRILGAGVDRGNGDWEFQWPVDLVDNGSASITAEATQGDGTAISQALLAQIQVELPPQPAYLSRNPDQFVLLDTQGKPLPGRPVRADAQGNLPPCEFRPLGHAPRGIDYSPPSGCRKAAASPGRKTPRCWSSPHPRWSPVRPPPSR